MKQVFKYISARGFFNEYAPSVRNYTHKMRGTDGNGNPINFSKEDKKAIKTGLKKMVKECVHLIDA